MQLTLPIFPVQSKYINSFVAFVAKDGFVYYFHSSRPVYCHKEDDHEGYRHTLASLVSNNLCSIGELSKAIGESRRNIERYAKAFKTHGAAYFFNRDDGRGQCHKYTPELVCQVQAQIDAGRSQYRISKNLGISSSSISYHIKKGTLRAKPHQDSTSESPNGSTPSQRSREDLAASHGQGMAVTFEEERMRCSLGLLDVSPLRFQACQTIPMGGVMLLLPFLVASGLMSYQNHYRQRDKGYYSFDCLLITMAFMYLCRIKSFEQIKHENPGDWGKLIGYDRMPEVKTMRGLVRLITDQNKCSEWSASLADQWIKAEEPEVYYVDGHVQVYHGHLANLGLKHSSRERLCLPGMMEYWVNSSTGMPFFFITANVNEKMIEMLKDEVVPKLIGLHQPSKEQKLKMEADEKYPLFTLTFDREAYSPDLFSYLWEKKIAVLTYRKYVKDDWEETVFEKKKVSSSMGEIVEMKLHQKEIDLLVSSTKEKIRVREVRKLCEDGRQISIVTTNWVLSMEQIASYMFSRWSQENFFRFMRQEYAIDKIIRYIENDVDGNEVVVNGAYSKLTYRISAVRGKLQTKQAQIYRHTQDAPQDLDEGGKMMRKWMKKKSELHEQETKIKQEIEKLIEERNKTPRTIKVSEMPKETRYTKTDQESKQVQNCVKMCCYWAETDLANRLAPHFSRDNDEIRALVKSITNTPIDMVPDYENEKLVITLYPLSNRRSMNAVEKILDTVNNTKTKYPGSKLVLFYQFATI